MSYLSRRDIDDLKPSIEKAVYKIIGNDSSILNASIHCLSSGYDKRRTTDKLSTYVDSKKAYKLAEKIFDLIDDLQSSHKNKKRSYEDENRERDLKRSKTTNTKYENKEKDSRFDVEKPRSNKPNESETSRGSLDKKLEAGKNVNMPNVPNIPPPSIYGIPMGLLNRGDADKARKIAQLHAQIKSQLSSGILGNVIQIPVTNNKPQPLILDEDGRTIDKTGKTVQLTHVVPTLKANIRALKREQFKSQSNDKSSEDSYETRFVDNRIGIKPPQRNRRALRFHEPGKFQQFAERLRMKAQLEKLQNEISQIAKKTGISSATKLALIAKSEGHSDDIPQMEWWDSVILVDDLDTMRDGKIAIKETIINTLVEHPTQMRCPSKY